MIVVPPQNFLKNMLRFIITTKRELANFAKKEVVGHKTLLNHMITHKESSCKWCWKKLPN